MADVHDKITRSFNMSRIKGKNTKPEILVRKYIFSKGLRFRLHDKRLSGKPDIILKRYNTIIFINGCFWHGHRDCQYSVLPKTRFKWWEAKIEKTKQRDILNYSSLKAEGWQVIVIWECELKAKTADHTLDNLISRLKSTQRL